MRQPCTAAIFLFFMVSIGVCQVDDMRYFVECSRGVSFVSNAVASRDGRVVVVGDLGRMGVIGQTDREFTWYCLPEQTFLFDAWMEHDSIVVVGEKGAVWWRVGTDEWRSAKIPANEVCRSIARKGAAFYVGTEQGGIWKCTDLSSTQWTREAEMPSSILDIYSDDSTLVAVGGYQGLYEWSVSDGKWQDLSQHESPAVYSAVRVYGGYYVIGADSGRVIRYDPVTHRSLVSQLFAPSLSTPMPDFRGRNDRTLSFCVGPANELIVTGFYPDRSRSATGIYSSTDSGMTWRHYPFFDSDSTFESFSTEYCPLVMYHDTVLTALVASLGSPIVTYRSSNRGSTWKKGQSSSMYQLLPNTSNIPDSTWHTFVDAISGIVVDADRQQFITTSYAIPQNSDDNRYPFTRTFVVQWTKSQDAMILDTISVISGKYGGLQRKGKQLLMCGDSLRLAISDDNGRSWDFSRIDSLSAARATATQIILKDGRVGYAGNVGYVYIERAARWEMMQLRSDKFARPIVVQAVKYDYNSALVEVDYYQQSTLLYRSIHMLIINGSTHTMDSIATIPDRSYYRPALFADNDTVVIIMPTMQSPEMPKGGQLRCRYIGDVWQCDTMYILDGKRRVPFSGSDQMTLYDHGDAVVCELFSGGRAYSLDRCRTWSVMPQASTYFNGSLWATAFEGKVLYIAGYRYMLASISLPLVTSASHGFDPPEKESFIMSARDFFTEHQDVTMRVSSILGAHVVESATSEFPQMHERISQLANGMYVILLLAPRERMECTVIVHEGDMYVPTFKREAITK